MRPNDENRWLRRVRSGDFCVIPAPFTWSHSGGLAHLIDGYAITGGFEPLAAISRRVFDEMRRDPQAHVTALDLWLTLFWQHRGYRNQGYHRARTPSVSWTEFASSCAAP